MHKWEAVDTICLDFYEVLEKLPHWGLLKKVFGEASRITAALQCPLLY